MLEFCSLIPNRYWSWAASSQLAYRPWLLLGALAHVLRFESSIALLINGSYHRKTVRSLTMKEKLGGYCLSLGFLYVVDKKYCSNANLEETVHRALQTSLIYSTAGGIVVENKTSVRRVSRVRDCVLLKSAKKTKTRTSPITFCLSHHLFAVSRGVGGGSC